MTGVDLAVLGSETWSLSFEVAGRRVEIAPLRGLLPPLVARVYAADGKGGASKVGARDGAEAVASAAHLLRGLGVDLSIDLRRALQEVVDAVGRPPAVAALSVAETPEPGAEPR